MHSFPEFAFGIYFSNKKGENLVPLESSVRSDINNTVMQRVSDSAKKSSVVKRAFKKE
jgi:hypothetical protein